MPNPQCQTKPPYAVLRISSTKLSFLNEIYRSNERPKDTLSADNIGRETLFLPIISAEISAETLSVINLLSAYLQKELLLAERASFGRKTRFWQSRYILVVYCYPTLWPKTLQPVSKWHDILQKDTLSAERPYFGRKRHYRQNIGFGRNS